MGTLELTIRPPLRREDLPGLCARVGRLLSEQRPGHVRCDVSDLPADAVALDALGRLRLATQRHRCSLGLHGTTPDLGRFIAFAGLDDVLS